MKSTKQKIRAFLLWLQKYTKTDNVYLFKGGFWLILGNIFSAVIAIFSSIAFANLLDPVTYGNYRYILSVAGILGIFSLGGIATAVAQAVARGLEGSFYTGLKVRLKWGMLGSLGALLLAGYYFIKGNYLLLVPLLTLAVFLPLMRSFNIYSSFLEGKKVFSSKIKYSIFSHFLSVATSVGVLLITKNLIWLVAAYFISNVSLNCFFYLRTKKKFQPNRREDPQTISYGKHLTLIGTLGEIASQLDRVLLFTFIGANQLSVFTFALLIPDQIRNIFKNIVTLAFPKLSVKSITEIKKGMRQKTWQLFALAIIVVISYIIIAPYIYKLIFPQYPDSIFYSQIYILSVMTLPVILMMTTFRAKLMKKELYLLQINSFVQIILSFILIPKFGILGAILSRLIVKFIGILLTLFLFKKS